MDVGQISTSSWTGTPGGQWLDLVVGVIGPKRSRQIRIELPMRRSEPALGDRSVRVDGTLEHDLFTLGVVDPEDHEDDRRRRWRTRPTVSRPGDR